MNESEQKGGPPTGLKGTPADEVLSCRFSKMHMQTMRNNPISNGDPNSKEVRRLFGVELQAMLDDYETIERVVTTSCGIEVHMPDMINLYSQQEAYEFWRTRMPRYFKLVPVPARGCRYFLQSDLDQ